MADKSPGDDFELSDSALDVGIDIGSCIEQAKVEKSNHLVGPDVFSSLKCSVSLHIRQRHQMSDARREACVMTQSDTSDQLYTRVDEVTGHANDEVVLATLISLNALLEPDETSVD